EAPRVRWDILDAFCAAAEQAGIKRIPDFNTGDNEGSCVFHVNQKRGRRWSAARGFLKPVLNRANLRLETHCLVEGIAFNGPPAAGVRWGQNGAAGPARARGEVILAAGSIGSIQILKLSGVGGAEELKPLGIPVVLDKPASEQPPGSSPASAHLQGRGRQDPQRDLSLAYRPRAHGARLCAVSPRAAYHGAFAARAVH